MDYVVFHSLDVNPSGAFLGIGGPDEQGVIIASLADFVSPIYGSIKLNDEESFELYANRMFVGISVGDGRQAVCDPPSPSLSFCVSATNRNRSAASSTPITLSGRICQAPTRLAPSPFLTTAAVLCASTAR